MANDFLESCMKFKKEMDALDEQIDESVVDALKRVAKTASAYLIKYSPCWTGSYIASHNVGLNKRDTRPRYTKYATEFDIQGWGGTVDASGERDFPQRMPYTEEMEHRTNQLRQMKRTIDIVGTIEGIGANTVIYITNPIGHAPMIEYSGWPPLGGKKIGKQPYHTYFKAATKAANTTLTAPGIDVRSSGTEGIEIWSGKGTTSGGTV